MMTDFLMGYITCKNEIEAEKIAVTLLDSNLIACANIFPEMKSYYKWEGSVTHSEETLLIVKTQKTHAEELKTKVIDMHSYDVPCILFYPVENGLTSYLNWIKKET